MRMLALHAKILSHINEQPMTSSCPKIFGKSFSAKLTQHYRHFRVRQSTAHKCHAQVLTRVVDSSLPTRVDEFHSLVPLDVTHKGSQIHGYKTWVYKATRSRDGATYVLRRIEGPADSTLPC